MFQAHSVGATAAVSTNSWPQWSFYPKREGGGRLGAGRQNKQINAQDNLKSNIIRKTGLDCARVFCGGGEEVWRVVG